MGDVMWKMGEGRCKREDVRWKVEDGRWKMEDGRGKREGGGCMDNLTREKSMNFAVRVVKLCNLLKDTKKEFNISNQLFRSATSIGANYSEAQNGASKKDFTNKVIIALKEARETEFWIELLFKTDYISKQEYESISKDCDELLRILTAIVKKSKDNNYEE